MNRTLAPALLLLLLTPVQAMATEARRTCSMDAMPPADKQRMIREYLRRKGSDGQASADNWAREQGNAFRRKLVAEGICPPLAQGTAPSPSRKPPPDGRGKPCSSMRVENRVTPGFGGAPMTMNLVPVCAD